MDVAQLKQASRQAAAAAAIAPRAEHGLAWPGGDWTELMIAAAAALAILNAVRLNSQLMRPVDSYFYLQFMQ